MNDDSTFNPRRQLVQIIDGLGSVPPDEDIYLAVDVAQWETQPGGDFCEREDEGDCDSGSVSWGTSFPYDPLFCTKHFFDGSTGFDFAEAAESDLYHHGAP